MKGRPKHTSTPSGAFPGNRIVLSIAWGFPGSRIAVRICCCARADVAAVHLLEELLEDLERVTAARSCGQRRIDPRGGHVARSENADG